MPLVEFSDGRTVKFPEPKYSDRTIPQIRKVMKGLPKPFIDNAVKAKKMRLAREKKEKAKQKK